MIFLSHKYEDKDFVGPIAQELKEAYGEEKVFFDDWSINPGENIIERMGQGLEECEFFLFFITENSLKSDMVTLEWTTAIKEKSRRNIKFIPIRADNVSVPILISTLRYLDLYNHGMEVIMTQIREIIEDEIRTQDYPAFQNLQAYSIQADEDTIEFYITSKRFFEPNSKFLVLTDLNEDEATFDYSDSGMSFKNFFAGMAKVEGSNEPLNAFYLGIEGGIHKGYKIKIVFHKRVERSANINLAHRTSETKFNSIPITALPSIAQLPQL